MHHRIHRKLRFGLTLSKFAMKMAIVLYWPPPAAIRNKSPKMSTGIIAWRRLGFSVLKMGFIRRQQKMVFPLIAMAAAFGIFGQLAAPARALAASGNVAALGTIKGVVLDQAGKPIADATVAIFRLGTSKLLKKVHSASDGKFFARVVPGTYTLLAVAQGFNPETLEEVEIGRSGEFNYGFKLERAGSGNTLPEKREDRNNPKWIIRSAQNSRTIFQHTEGETPIDETSAEETETITPGGRSGNETARRGQSVVETYFGGSSAGGFRGINYATLIPVGDSAEVIIAAQGGMGEGAPQSIESQINFRPNSSHQLRFRSSFGHLGSIRVAESESALGQMAFQVLDEWRVREGVILVYGLDYSRLTGAGSDQLLSPRLGLQFDLNSRTRFRAAYTTRTDERTWANAIEFENASVAFREPVAIEDVAIENGKPMMAKSRRLEFGIERVLDKSSSIEANVFFDTVTGRGVGFISSPFAASGNFTENISENVAEQQGNARGVRLVYTRRINGLFSTSAGYSFGNGQGISANALNEGRTPFEDGIFHTFFGRFEADLRSGTHVRTIFRLSPRATVFAIDPFQGRLAIYDPSLSVMVTQSLPNLGLPFEAEATVDARNLFDFQPGTNEGENGLRLNSQRRMLRGGILVRF